MSTRTRSSTRIQALQNTEELNGPSEAEAHADNAEEPYNLEEKEQEIWDEVRDEHYDSEPFISFCLTHTQQRSY